MSNRFFWGALTALALVLTGLLLTAAAAPSGRAAYQVPRITCGACSASISQGLQTSAGVGEVQVDVASRMVRVAYDPAVTDPGEIALALGGLGYPGRLVGVGPSASPAATAGGGGCGGSCCNKAQNP